MLELHVPTDPVGLLANHLDDGAAHIAVIIFGVDLLLPVVAVVIYLVLSVLILIDPLVLVQRAKARSKAA